MDVKQSESVTLMRFLTILLLGIIACFPAVPLTSDRVEEMWPIYRDDHGATVQEIQDIHHAEFASKNIRYSEGYVAGSTWIRLDKSRFPAMDTELYIQFRFSPLDKVILRWQDQSGRWLSEMSGRRVPFSDWAIKSRKITFSLKDKFISSPVIFIQVQTAGASLLDFELHSGETLSRSLENESVIWGALIGIAIFAILYNLAAWFFFKEVYYLYYLGFLCRTRVF